MKSIKKYFFIAALFSLAITSCKDDDEEVVTPPANPALNIYLKFEVDSVALTFNQINYTNAASDNYSVTTLLFYLSKFNLIKSDGQKISLSDYMYVDASVPPVISIPISSLSQGDYTGLSFNIGLDSAQNVPGGLPPTLENLAMEWPVAMGGGYHFMKLEGNFLDSSGTPGYAMHLGNNMSLCPVNISYNFNVSNTSVNMTLVMNINEWFRDPYIYDFNVDGNYSMGNMMAMSKLSANGYNVFSMR